MNFALTFQVVSVDGGPKVYYAGDTGYCPVFPEIGEMGPFNLSLIPIVPEEPRQFLVSVFRPFIFFQVNESTTYRT